jgi:pimeloyl-ACP methyl ester carboxylesterase
LTEQTTHRSIWGHLSRTAFCQKWIDAGGVSTRYVQAGSSDAPALIMLPGTGGSWETYCANLEAHSQHFNCFAIDFAGSGFSDKPDEPYEINFYVNHILNFMNAVGLKTASLVGVSLGAWVAGRFAVDHPDRLDKVTLIAPSGMIINKATLNRTKGVRNSAIDDPSWDNIARVFDSILYDKNDRLPDLVQVRQQIYQLPEMKRAMANILVLQEAEVRERNLVTEADWATVKAPVLVIIATDDNDDYVYTGRRIVELAENARGLEIAKVKHWAHFERPELFNAANIAFLKEGLE